MPVSLIQATAEEAADNFRPAHHPLLSPFSVHSGLFRWLSDPLSRDFCSHSF